jgi:anti-sigma factor ChrR (cupin superfamily)
MTDGHGPQGWTFSDAAAQEWQQMGPGVEMKALGSANGRLIALFKFDPGYSGSAHEHNDAEFSYLLEGDLVSNGVEMAAGHAYAAEAGTTHSEFRTSGGATLVSVFQIPN